MRIIKMPGFESEVRIPKVVDRLGGNRAYGWAGLETVKWLIENIGPGMPALDDERLTLFRPDSDVWYNQVWFGYITYHFKHPRDATLFALKFG